MVRLEKKFSRTCSSCESSDLGNAARDAIALWRELILSSKVGCNMPPEPPVATCVPWILSKTAMLGNTNWACEIKYQSNLHYLIYDLFAKI
jgi:hypothetical protein